MGHTRGPSPGAPHKASLVSVIFPTTGSKMHSLVEDLQGKPVLPLLKLGTWGQAFWGSSFPLWTILIQKQLLHSETLSYDCPGTASGLLFLSRSSRVALAIPAALIPASGCSCHSNLESQIQQHCRGKGISTPSLPGFHQTLSALPHAHNAACDASDWCLRSSGLSHLYSLCLVMKPFSSSSLN